MRGQIDLYRSQHRDLHLAAEALAKLLDHQHLAHGGAAARSTLSHLAGKLTVHLDMEERSLYPELLVSEDARVREVALRFQADHRNLRVKAQLLFTTWLRPEAIGADPKGFAAAARWLLHVLAAMISAEDSELYDLVDGGE